MASDSRATRDGETIPGTNIQKIFIVGNGAGLLGMCGVPDWRLLSEEHFQQIVDFDTFVAWIDLLDDHGQLAEWMAVFGDAPNVFYHAIPNKMGKAIKSQIVIQTVDPEYGMAIGSGASYALGAMAQGATAEEAVEIAALFDTCTGGDTEAYELNG